MPKRCWKHCKSMTKTSSLAHKNGGVREAASADMPAQPTSDLSQWRLLPRSFFEAAPELAARSLLGKILAHRVGNEILAGRIVETEAYLGADDAAAHAASGPTARNLVLFGPAGHAYVYGIYGLHSCMNVSCLQAGDAGCVLLRALEPVAGTRAMRANRALAPGASLALVASGPGKLCQALGIARPTHNGMDLTRSDSPLAIYDDGHACKEITVAKRIGIRKAAELPLRFFLTGHCCVSAHRR